MRDWLSSNEIAALTDLGDWPTAEMAALWRRFRDDVLSGGTQAWSIASWKRLLNLPDGTARRQASTASKRVPMIPTRPGSRHPITGASRRLKNPSAT
jgi:hypothetical protein